MAALKTWTFTCHLWGLLRGKAIDRCCFIMHNALRNNIQSSALLVRLMLRRARCTSEFEAEGPANKRGGRTNKKVLLQIQSEAIVSAVKELFKEKELCKEKSQTAASGIGLRESLPSTRKERVLLSLCKLKALCFYAIFQFHSCHRLAPQTFAWSLVNSWFQAGFDHGSCQSSS